MRIGTDQSYISLKDQREALASVQQQVAVPARAVVIGLVDASRCHRFAGHNKPTEADVVIDLKVAAYAKGADGIAEVEVIHDSGLGNNCWEIWTGKAKAFTLPK